MFDKIIHNICSKRIVDIQHLMLRFNGRSLHKIRECTWKKECILHAYLKYLNCTFEIQASKDIEKYTEPIKQHHSFEYQKKNAQVDYHVLYTT